MHKPLLLFLYLTLAGVASTAGVSSTRPAPSGAAATQATARSLGALMTAAAAVGFSGVVLVAQDDRILLRQAYGLANRSTRTPVAIEMPFDIGSITKQFTAAAILRLEMQGKLDVQQPISAYLDSVPADKAGITLHHVLTHTAGFPEYSGDDYVAATRDSTVKNILATPIESKPGSAFEYSNAGYSLLAAIVEHVSGQPYERFLSEFCFGPAGLAHTGYRLLHFNPGNLPHGYTAATDNGTALDHLWADDGPYWNLFGNGGMLSTVDDLYAWSKALEGNTVLSAAARERLFTPYLREYAYGWNVRDTPHGRRIWHGGGSDNGFNAVVAWYPERNIHIVVTSNAGETEDGLGFATAVGAMLERRLFDPSGPGVAELHVAEIPPAALARCTGTYRLPTGGTLTVQLGNSRLQIEPVGQDATDLLLLSPDADTGPYVRCSQKTAAIVAGFAKGDFSTLQKSVADSARAARYTTYFAETMQKLAKEYGPGVGFDILGTTTTWWTTGDDLATIVRLRCERGAQIFRLQWKDGLVNAIGGDGIPSPARTPLAPTSATTFVGFHLGIARPVEVAFLPAAPGPAATLQISRGGPAVTARRVR